MNAPAAQPLRIDADFPGGNIVVESIDGDDVRLHQDLRDTAIDWFYWCFRIRGAAGRTLRFHFTRGRAIGVRGPAVSFDHGRTWAWLGAAAVVQDAFTFTFPAGADDARFSFGMPYQAADFDRFIARYADHPHLALRRLCTTPAGRDIEYALLGHLGPDPAHRVVLTARHHCCEMMPSYTLEGLIESVADATSDAAQWLRAHATFLIVPFIDKDGVEAGDQGKARRPRDHGRDYAGESLYASTGALRELLPAWSAGRLHAVLDLHCPHISGPNNEKLYVVGSADEAIAREQARFAELLESHRTGPLPFFAADTIPFGTSWVTAANYADGAPLPTWAGTIPGVRLATAIEVPYANAHGVEVNATTARRFGPDLAAALAAYLRA